MAVAQARRVRQFLRGDRTPNSYADRLFHSSTHVDKQFLVLDNEAVALIIEYHSVSFYMLHTNIDNFTANKLDEDDHNKCTIKILAILTDSVASSPRYIIAHGGYAACLNGVRRRWLKRRSGWTRKTRVFGLIERIRSPANRTGLARKNASATKRQDRLATYRRPDNCDVGYAPLRCASIQTPGLEAHRDRRPSNRASRRLLLGASFPVHPALAVERSGSTGQHRCAEASMRTVTLPRGGG